MNSRIQIKQIIERDMLRQFMPSSEAVCIIKIRENEHRFRSDLKLHSLVLVTTDIGLVLYKVTEMINHKGLVSITLTKHRCIYSDELCG